MSLSEEWTGEQTAWMAKMRRARLHIAELHRVEQAYMASAPAWVEQRTTEPGSIELVYRQRHAPPLDLSLILGDVVHNLRSALDALTTALVRHRAGRVLTDEEEKACQFLVEKAPLAFDKAIDRHGTRRLLYDEVIRKVLREVQPFRVLETVAEHNGGELPAGLTYEGLSADHPLVVLRQLSNIDKHRRLTVAAFLPGLPWWSHEAGTDPRVSFTYREPPPWQDGVVFALETHGHPAPTQVKQEVQLMCTDSPRADSSIGAQMKSLAEAVAMAVSTMLSDYDRSTRREPIRNACP